MIRKPELVAAFEKSQIRQEPVDYVRNLRIVEGLYHEARQLNALPLKNPLDGIDVDIHLARVINVRTSP
jgi:hypothetical protein